MCMCKLCVEKQWHKNRSSNLRKEKCVLKKKEKDRSKGPCEIWESFPLSPWLGTMQTEPFFIFWLSRTHTRALTHTLTQVCNLADHPASGTPPGPTSYLALRRRSWEKLHPSLPLPSCLPSSSFPHLPPSLSALIHVVTTRKGRRLWPPSVKSSQSPLFIYSA